MERVRVRFAPSPTGPLHIGGARSALFNYLIARRYQGSLVLRIEDTDLERSSKESELNIMESLKWLGIDWDEGPDVGGDYGPYRQTERLNIYRKYIEQLLAKGQAYYCYCSEEELEAEREELMAKGELPRYLGKCRNLTDEQRTAYEKCGRKPVVRFRVPGGQTVVIDDQVRGQVSFETDGIGDFVILKSDGIPTYNFAVVIDDALMKITHVIRAEEHLSNTPRQVLIYDALGMQPPKFAHVSLILGKDRTKMSKRHGATSVVQYREDGYLPEAIINFLALLGWAPGGEEEFFSMAELIEQFSLERVAKNPAVFDMDKLKWLNGYYIRKSPVERITELAIPYLQEAGYLSQDITPEQYEWAKLLVTAVQEDLSCVKDVTQLVKGFLDYPDSLGDEEIAVLREEQVPRVLQAFKDKIAQTNDLTVDRAEQILKQLTKELKLGGRKVYMPLRVALTGQQHGPELYYIIPILGKDRMNQRISDVLGRLS